MSTFIKPEDVPPEPVIKRAANEAPQSSQEAMYWWHAHGLPNGWYPGYGNGAVLTTKTVETDAAAAICAILHMNGIPANNGDGVGMIANLMRHLAYRAPVAQVEWQRRENPEGDVPAGDWWASDGKLVWMIHSTGTPGAFVGAKMIRFLAPCVVPPPPAP